MKNIKWKRPHDTFFAGIILVPGEDGNFVTDEQLAAMRENRMFKQCEILGHAVVTDSDAAPALREDGPTLKDWLAKGNNEVSYPPIGFAAKGVAEYHAEVKAAQEKAEADRLEEEAKNPPLRTDGPTLFQYTSAGYPAAKYPPADYAVRVDPEADKKLEGELLEKKAADEAAEKAKQAPARDGGKASEAPAAPKAQDKPAVPAGKPAAPTSKPKG